MSFNSYYGSHNPSHPQGSAFRYGFAQAVVRVDKGQGLWPAFWMMPKNNPNVNSEVDIYEGPATDGSPIDAYMSIHPSGGGLEQGHYTGVDFSQGFHTIGLEWDANHIIQMNMGKKLGAGSRGLFNTNFSNLHQIRMSLKHFFNAVLFQGGHTVIYGLITKIFHFSFDLN